MLSSHQLPYQMITFDDNLMVFDDVTPWGIVTASPSTIFRLWSHHFDDVTPRVLWRHPHPSNPGAELSFPLYSNKQKERWQGHRNSCGQLQRARILIKKTRNIKKHSDARETTATYNKLLDETRDEHYYILNR